MREKRFIVKPDKKVVVTILDASESGVTDEVVSRCTKPTMYAVLNLIMNAYDMNIPDLEIPYNASYKGVSICDEHDTFDEKKGKDISGSKADMKYHIAMAKKYKRLSEIFDRAQKEMRVLELEHQLKSVHIEEKLYKYLEPNTMKSRQ